MCQRPVRSAETCSRRLAAGIGCQECKFSCIVPTQSMFSQYALTLPDWNNSFHMPQQRDLLAREDSRGHTSMALAKVQRIPLTHDVLKSKYSNVLCLLLNLWNAGACHQEINSASEKRQQAGTAMPSDQSITGVHNVAGQPSKPFPKGHRAPPSHQLFGLVVVIRSQSPRFSQVSSAMSGGPGAGCPRENHVGVACPQTPDWPVTQHMSALIDRSVDAQLTASNWPGCICQLVSCKSCT